MGPAVAAWWARHSTVPLMKWQELVLGGTLTATDAGRWEHRHALWSVARQNGKTRALEALLCWWLTEHADAFGPQEVALASHDLKLTSVVFTRVAELLAAHGYLADRPLGGKPARQSFGRQDLYTATGSTLVVQSSSVSAGHGLTPDLIVVDEVWRVAEDVVEEGFIPSQRARPNPLLVLASTAGDEASLLLKRWREDGMRSIEDGGAGSLYFAEWSLPPIADPYDERWWRWANPALGVTITLETMRLEARKMKRADFLRADLNLWVATENGWLQPGAWDALADPGRELPAGGILSCDSSLDGARWVGVRAVVGDDGRVGVECPLLEPNEPAFWARLTALCDADPKLRVTLPPGFDQHAPLKVRNRYTIVDAGDQRLWTTPVRASIIDGRVWHRGQVTLTEQVNRAVLASTERGDILSKHRSPGPIELARCLVWATWLAQRPTSTARPTLGVAAG